VFVAVDEKKVGMSIVPEGEVVQVDAEDLKVSTQRVKGVKYQYGSKAMWLSRCHCHWH
jgi:hypothetical protein